MDAAKMQHVHGAGNGGFPYLRVWRDLAHLSLLPLPWFSCMRLWRTTRSHRAASIQPS
jgi:hypothetical protein